jgi:hypothetical protein
MDSYQDLTVIMFGPENFAEITKHKKKQRKKNDIFYSDSSDDD